MLLNQMNSLNNNGLMTYKFLLCKLSFIDDKADFGLERSRAHNY